MLKEWGIALRAKPLGRPAKDALHNQVSPGGQNPIEGKFGQAKAGYNMECIKAKLQNTSELCIASTEQTHLKYNELYTIVNKDEVCGRYAKSYPRLIVEQE